MSDFVKKTIKANLGNFISQSNTLEAHHEDTLIKISDGHKESMSNMSYKRSIDIKTPQRKDTNEDNDSKDEKSNGDDDLDYAIVNAPTQPYFEKQSWEMCLLHSLNALYQTKKFSETDMDEICKTLAPNKLINPHKSIFNTGNYDANVLMMALENDGVDVQWFDSRKATQKLRLTDAFLCPEGYTKFQGFILNNPHKRMVIFNRRHWLTIKRIGLIWYNLDSRLKEPIKYEGNTEIKKLQKWLIECVTSNDAQLMICRVKNKKVKKSISRSVSKSNKSAKKKDKVFQ